MGRKGFRFVGVLMLLLLLGSCKATTDQRRDAVLHQLAGAYTFTGTATVEGLSQPVKLRGTKAATGLTLELLEPEAIAGLWVSFGEAGTAITYRGLAMQLGLEEIPEQSILVALREALADIPAEEAELTEEAGLLTVCSKAGLLPYSTVWSLERCALVAIELPTLGGGVTVEKFEKAVF